MEHLIWRGICSKEHQTLSKLGIDVGFLYRITSWCTGNVLVS
jgi:hypothetical protein